MQIAGKEGATVPTYVFTCKACEREFSLDMPWSRKGEARCPECGGGELKEMFGRYALNVISVNGGDECDGGMCCCGDPSGGCRN